MNDVESHLMNVMNERLFHKVVTDDFVFVEGLIDEDDLDDGKKYTLISGETRCRAIDRLYSFNTSLKIYHDGYIDAIIVSKPKDELEERKIAVIM